MFNWFKGLFIKELSVVLNGFNKVVVDLEKLSAHRKEVVAGIDKAVVALNNIKAVHINDIATAEKVAANIKKLTS